MHALLQRLKRHIGWRVCLVMKSARRSSSTINAVNARSDCRRVRLRLAAGPVALLAFSGICGEKPRIVAFHSSSHNPHLMNARLAHGLSRKGKCWREAARVQAMSSSSEDAITFAPLFVAIMKIGLAQSSSDMLSSRS